MESSQQIPDTCEQCGSPNIRSEQIRSAFWHEDRLVVVADIPALVCDNCREQFYDDATVAKIDLLRGESFPPDQAQDELRVPVFSLQQFSRRNKDP